MVEVPESIQASFKDMASPGAEVVMGAAVRGPLSPRYRQVVATTWHSVFSGAVPGGFVVVLGLSTLFVSPIF